MVVFGQKYQSFRFKSYRNNFSTKESINAVYLMAVLSSYLYFTPIIRFLSLFIDGKPFAAICRFRLIFQQKTIKKQTTSTLQFSYQQPRCSFAPF